MNLNKIHGFGSVPLPVVSYVAVLTILLENWAVVDAKTRHSLGPL
jgi:hypothetical protein